MHKFWLFLVILYDEPGGMDGFQGAFDSFDEASTASFELNDGRYYEAQIVEVVNNTPGRQWRREIDASDFVEWDESASND